ncbi:MAG: HEPN domain-containing protein [Blastocatellia bacterium]
MMLRADLKKIARGRLQDAEVLNKAGRYDGAVYLCGYAVEIALKARICYTLKWPGFPSTRKEFEGYQSFRTHNLVVLLHLSGAEDKIKTRYFADWSVVVDWDPEARYRSIGSASPQDVAAMIESTKAVLEAL